MGNLTIWVKSRCCSDAGRRVHSQEIDHRWRDSDGDLSDDIVEITGTEEEMIEIMKAYANSNQSYEKAVSRAIAEFLEILS